MAVMSGSLADQLRAARPAGRRARLLPAKLVVPCAWALIAAGVVGRPAPALAQGSDAPPAASPATAAGRAAPEAQGGAAQTERPPAQPVNLTTHAIVFVTGAATLAVMSALQSHLAPAQCRWCDLHSDGTDALNGLDRAARNALLWQHPDKASTVSDVITFGVVPAVAFGLDGWAAHASGHGDDFKVDGLVIGESIVLAANAAELLKYTTARLRPYAHARALGEPTVVAPTASDNMSFVSGHTAVAFAMTVSAARVMTLRGYGHEGWVWGLGLPAAAAVGYLRVAADRHYLTDVLASAGIGTAVGLIVPRLVFTTRSAGHDGVTITPLISGSMLAINCSW